MACHAPLCTPCNDEVPGLQVRGTQSVVDCLLEYSGKHKAGLIIMGSQQVHFCSPRNLLSISRPQSYSPACPPSVVAYFHTFLAVHVMTQGV